MCNVSFSYRWILHRTMFSEINMFRYTQLVQKYSDISLKGGLLPYATLTSVCICPNTGGFVAACGTRYVRSTLRGGWREAGGQTAESLQGLSTENRTNNKKTGQT